MTATQSQIRDKPKSRESIISEVESQMGYYDIPEAEPSISFTGKSVCELVDLAKILMAENDELDEAAHNKSLEVMKLQSALDTQKPAGDAGLTALETLTVLRAIWETEHPDDKRAAKSFDKIEAALNGDCGGGVNGITHDKLGDVVAAFVADNDSEDYPFEGEEYDVQLARYAFDWLLRGNSFRLEALTADDRQPRTIDYHLNALRELGHDVQIVVKEGEE